MASFYTAFFDESGTHTTSDVVVVAGFVSDESNWEQFSQEWQEVLDYAQIDHFHMNDFENGQGQFSSWNTQERKDRLNRFLTIIHKYVFSSVGCVIPKQAFDTIFSGQAQAICGDAYGLAAMACFDSLRQIARNPKIDGWMKYILESGAKGRDAISRHHAAQKRETVYQEASRILSVEFRDKRRCLPLQASDILAYELYKHLPKQLGLTKKRPDRYPLRQLSTILHQWHYLTDNELKRQNQILSTGLME